MPAASESDTAPPGTVGMRGYFSTNFLWTALHTSRRVHELEIAGGSSPRFDMAHRSYAVSSVIASAAFVEAAVSELFQDAHDGHGLSRDGYLAPLSAKAVEAMAQIWQKTDRGRRLSPLDKWQELLDCCGRNRLELGAAPAQDAGLLIDLRNSLVHHKPETIWAGDQHKLQGKFPNNQLMEGSGNPWWPSHGLGHGCSEWAVRSARELADRVVDEVGIEPNYRRIEKAGWNGKLP